MSDTVQSALPDVSIRQDEGRGMSEAATPMTQEKVCPVCPHPVDVHDGMGCTQDVDGVICVCPVSQNMPGAELSQGVHWRKPDTE